MEKYRHIGPQSWLFFEEKDFFGGQEIRTKASSHSFRKSSAAHMLRNGARLETVQALHVDISATQVVTKVYPQDIIKMHRAFHPRERQKMPELYLNSIHS